MTAFQYHQAIVERFPTIVGGVILTDGLTNGETPAELREIYSNEQEAVKQRIGTTPSYICKRHLQNWHSGQR